MFYKKKTRDNEGYIKINIGLKIEMSQHIKSDCQSVEEVND